MLGDAERFVFHRAAEMPRAAAPGWVARAARDAAAQAVEAMRKLAARGDVVGCAIIAKGGAIPELDEVLASHPRIHAAEGLFYRDVLVGAAKECGLPVCLVPPAKLDVKDPRLLAAGRLAGKPWARDWKLAALAAWQTLEA